MHTCQPSRIRRDSPAFSSDVPRSREISRCPAFFENGIIFLQYVAHGENEVDCVMRAETMVAYWIAHHNLPMSAADEFSRMVPKLFPDSKIAKTVFSWLHIYIPDLLIS